VTFHKPTETLLRRCNACRADLLCIRNFEKLLSDVEFSTLIASKEATDRFEVLVRLSFGELSVGQINRQVSDPALTCASKSVRSFSSAVNRNARVSDPNA
jgi:hypothetical protein